MIYKGNKINDFILQDETFTEFCKRKGVDLKTEEICGKKAIGVKCFLHTYFSKQKECMIYNYEFIMYSLDGGFGSFVFQSMNKIEDPYELLEQSERETDEIIKKM